MLEQLLLDGELRREVGLAGLHVASQHYTIEKVTEQWAQVLTEVLEGH